MSFELGLPVKHVIVNQPFGVNYVNFYTLMGLKGHNGIDFHAVTGCPIYASHGGKITMSGIDGDGGCVIEILSSDKGAGIRTTYYHLELSMVKVGQEVKKGQQIATADNTGRYTTGDHLHFGAKLTFNGRVMDYDNGFRGAVNPALYFPKNWDKSNAYHRYGQKQNYWAEVWLKFAPATIRNQWADSGRWIQKKLRNLGLPMLSTEQANAIIYGSWDFETVINPAMRMDWAFLTKAEFLSGIRAFR
jgi:hypothetical protein